MARPRKISEEKINLVKSMITRMGLRECGRQVGLSFYTVWCIASGKYDSDQPLQVQKTLFNKCPITGK